MRLLCCVLSAALVAVLIAFSGCRPDKEVVNQPTPAQATPSAQTVPTQLPTSVRPLHYAIAVTPDAATLRFSGTVTIDIDVLQPTDSITLNAADLQFQSVAIGEGGPQSMAVGGKPSIDAKQTATFALPSKLTAGKHVLTINTRG